VLQIRLPPLRKRRQDILLLANHFLQRTLEEMGQTQQAPIFTPQAEALLLAYSWPGNIRELRNSMTRLAVRLQPELREISADFLLAALPYLETPVDCLGSDVVCIPANATLAEAEQLLIDAALERNNFNRREVARQLGIGERTLRRKLNNK